MASSWGDSWASSWGDSWGVMASASVAAGGGLNSGLTPKKYGKRPKYWWETDPQSIPDDIPLVGEVEQIKEEELALQATLTDMVRDRVLDSSIRILSSYAEILKEQREIKQIGLANSIKTENDAVSERTLRAKRLKKRMLLLLT